MKGINASKTLDEEKQICAGHKLEARKVKFYNYSNQSGMIKFTETEPISGYKSGIRLKVSQMNFLLVMEFSYSSFYLVSILLLVEKILVKVKILFCRLFCFAFINIYLMSFSLCFHCFILMCFQ